MNSQWTVDEKLILKNIRLNISYIIINKKSIDYDNIRIFLKKKILKFDGAIELYRLIFYMKFSKKIEKSKNKSRDVDIS